MAKLAFVGPGLMGMPMATRLLEVTMVDAPVRGSVPEATAGDLDFSAVIAAITADAGSGAP